MTIAIDNHEAPKDKIYAALFGIQEQINHRITKDSEADTGKYSYEYVSIEVVYDIIKPLCQDAGILVIQAHTESFRSNPEDIFSVNIKTTLVHVESGQRVSGTLTLPFSTNTQNPSQEAGKAITYGRRYSLVSMFGLTPVGEDNDANENGTSVFSRDRGPAKKSYAGKSAKPAAKKEVAAKPKKGGLLGKKKSDDTPAEKPKKGSLLGGKKKAATSKSKAKRPTKKKDDAASKFPKPEGETEDGAFNG